MTHFTPTAPDMAELSPVTRDAIDAYFVGQGQGFNAYTLRKQGMAELKRLDALSSGELAVLGLRRSQLPEHVFGELFAH